MLELRDLWNRASTYAADDDPLTAASNRLALILASNQPFYPLYVRWLTGETSGTLALTFLSTPFFLASPWVARLVPGVGRLWFPTVGALNTLFCGFVFGEGSGVEWFLLPCIVIACLSSRVREIGALFVYALFLAIAVAFVQGRFGSPLFPTEVAQTALRSLNQYSALSLSVIALWVLGSPRLASFKIAR